MEERDFHHHRLIDVARYLGVNIEDVDELIQRRLILPVEPDRLNGEESSMGPYFTGPAVLRAACTEQMLSAGWSTREIRAALNTRDWLKHYGDFVRKGLKGCDNLPLPTARDDD